MHEITMYICTKDNEVVFATGFLNEADLLFKKYSGQELSFDENGYAFYSHNGYNLATVDVNTPQHPFEAESQKIHKRIDYLRRVRKPVDREVLELKKLRSIKRRLKAFNILYSDLLLDLED
jgi:hypothetical protein